ncbi:Rv3654c family TadE-like protein [Nocardia sp. NPDC127579]|uniref:Rv3654c family TadE-like protein n=1 Tax=Nocardia sp. NPDC127579 TaxID=3345402 RepID=UPI00362A0E4D
MTPPRIAPPSPNSRVPQPLRLQPPYAPSPCAPSPCAPSPCASKLPRPGPRSARTRSDDSSPNHPPVTVSPTPRASSPRVSNRAASRTPTPRTRTLRAAVCRIVVRGSAGKAVGEIARWPSRRGVTVRARGDRWRGDGGGATVAACLALAGLIVATGLIGEVGVGVVARHRVQAAADLGALAGAGALVAGPEEGCAAAGEIVRLMGARMRGCEAAQWDVTVTAERNVPMGLFGLREVSAVARAGPVEEEL